MRTDTSHRVSAERAEPNHALFPRLIAATFRFYKIIFSPVFQTLSPSRCIYLPTCSEYAYTAISRFGVMRGSWLAVKRLAHCQPWGSGGLDPVPEPASHPHVCAKIATTLGPGQNGIHHLP